MDPSHCGHAGTAQACSGLQVRIISMPMNVIPVIDLMGGQVVRGVAGERDQYQPIQSHLVEGSEPGEVARALQPFAAEGILYVADLDAIQGGDVDWSSLSQVAATGLEIWLDAGITNLQRAIEVSQWRTENGQLLSGIIVGLESIVGPSALQAVLDVAGDRTIFSLDLKCGELLSDSPGWRNHTPDSVAHAAVSMGVKRIIVLDLAAVGRDAGLHTVELCRELTQRFPQTEFISGGGIRSAEDLAELERAGCCGALVSSALHAKGGTFYM